MSRRCTRVSKNLAAVFVALSVLLPAPAGAVAGFGDVDADKFYSEAVQWMVDEGLTNGTSPGCFSPAQSTTRGEVAVFLHRYAGQPDGDTESFTDVGPDDFHHAAVAWMASRGITTGATPLTFEPDRSVTRGELATFLHRLLDSPSRGPQAFDDVHTTDFFADAVAWMVADGITKGTSATTFHPNRPVTRAELATFLFRIDGSPPTVVAADGRCAGSPFEVMVSEAEAASWSLLNDLRATVGLPALPRDPAMDAFARDWSATMAATNDFSHSSGPFGENIAWWSRASATPGEAAQFLHNLWVNSPGHYANMTRGSYHEVGIGFWQSEDGWHATHVFR